ncbi:hypothetical protein [uncultured Litoreibacter sp.]|uniref:hypothetical protein n=1 Tax=uncultured Litoreibacter sp. TaxID=1392394 RepID=UPI00262376F8|nr:hypothetical protein [uncultured Litoreibacter sp.]
MYLRYFFQGVLNVLSLGLFTAFPAQAQNWLQIEARDIPAECTRPVSCIDRSQLALRNILNISQTDRDALLQTINRIATIRGLPDDVQRQPVIVPESMIEILHPMPAAAPLSLLTNHPGVFFDSVALDKNEETAAFGPYIREHLSATGVRFLTEKELERTPGHPKLVVRLTPRSDAEGSIIPFSVSMSISEEAVMVRNPSLKVSANTWSRVVKENLANKNYTPMSSLSQVVEQFVTDWISQNP